MSLAPETKSAVLRRFVAEQRARRRRTRLVLVATLALAVSAGAFALSRARSDPSDERAARFVDAVSYDQRGHLRFAHTGQVDVIVYDSTEVLSWIVAYGREHVDAELCMAGAGVPSRCFGTLHRGEDGTVNLSWSGRLDLGPYESVTLRAADGSVIGPTPLARRTG